MSHIETVGSSMERMSKVYAPANQKSGITEQA